MRWARLELEEPLEDLPVVVWRALLLAWVFGLGLAVTAAGLSYIGMAQVTRAEAHQPQFGGLAFLSDALVDFSLSSMYDLGYAINCFC